MGNMKSKKPKQLHSTMYILNSFWSTVQNILTFSTKCGGDVKKSTRMDRGLHGYMTGTSYMYFMGN